MAKRHAKNLIQSIADFFFICLIALGVGGVMYKILAPDGWFHAAMGELGKVGLVHALVFLAAAALTLFLAKRAMEGFNMKASLGNLIMYAWVLLGLYFGVRYFLTGSF